MRGISGLASRQHVLASATAIMMAAGATPAMAQTRTFDVPAGPASRTIPVFAKQAGIQILAGGDTVKSKRTRAVRGNLPVEEALRRFLEGTGLAPSSASTSGIITIGPVRVGNGSSRPAETASSLGEDASQEIVVTARKREELLRDVPMSITAIGANEIDRRGFVNSEDYLRGIPGVNQVDSSNGQSIVIRGMETSPQNQNFGAGATTATYFGETPTTNASGLGAGANIDLKLIDVERVEVLRGPQGTAFGNSSMGGAVRTIPRLPNLARVEGRAAAMVSETENSGGSNYALQAMFNLPIVSNIFAIRVVTYDSEDSGYYRNRARSDLSFQSTAAVPFGAQASAIDQSEVGAYHVRGTRVAALFEPDPDFRLSLSYLSQITHTNGFAGSTTGDYQQSIFQVAPEHRGRGQSEGVLDTNITIANATVSYDLHWAQVLATYSNTKSGSRRALPLASANYHLPASSDLDSDHTENVGEVRLASSLSGNLNFLIGVYRENIKDRAFFDYRWFGDPARNPFTPNGEFLGNQSNRWNLAQTAVFGELYWNIVPNLMLTAGARAYNYDRTVRTENNGFFFPGPSTSDRASASGTNFRANVRYEPNSRIMLYAGWAQGFRLGKPQPGLVPAQCDVNGDGTVDGTNISIASTRNVNSDNVDTYEAGAKLSFLSGRIRLDAAVFRSDWSNIPVNVVAGSLLSGCGQVYVANAGTARSEGAELQTRFRVTDAFSIDLGASWINARLTEDVPVQGFAAGDRLPGSPRFNGNLGLEYDFNLYEHNASLRTDVIYIGKFYGDIIRSPNTRAGDYTKIDVSGRVSFGNINLDIFVRNITNENAFTFRGPVPLTSYFGYQLRPRTIGTQLSLAL